MNSAKLTSAQVFILPLKWFYSFRVYNINFTEALLLYFLLPIFNCKFTHKKVQAGSAAAGPLIIELLCCMHALFMNESLS